MPKPKSPNVLAVCGDPSGANAVAPVIETLRGQRRVSVRALAYREAHGIWEKRGLGHQELKTPWDPSSAARHLEEAGASLLLAGTSFNDIGMEKHFTTSARLMGLPSLAVLDFWSNYAVRFSNQGRDLACVPDRIAVMDDWAVKEMVKEGFSPSCLVVTGQPARDDLAGWRVRFTPEIRRVTRLRLGAAEGELLVVFASQPLSGLFGTDQSNPLFCGYDEQRVARALLQALEHIAQRSCRSIGLVIRPHPRESPDSFNWVRGQLVRVLVSGEGESRNVAMSADLVTGMNTVLLVEACYLGCVTVSLQPDLLVTDTLPTNRLGLSYPAYSYQEVEPVVERMLLDQDARSQALARLGEMRLDNQATSRVVSLVYQMIGLTGDT